MAQIIDGKQIAETIRLEIKAEVLRVQAERGGSAVSRPGLATVIVGSRKDSETYVRLKHKAAEECGFNSIQITLPEDITEQALHDTIAALNADPNCHGMIVQLPLPKHINEVDALEKIDPSKDADGLHPMNVGLLNSKGRKPFFYPCTPMGCIELLKRSGVPIASKRAVVLGRSNIVGMPAAMLLMQNNATVTIVHSQTADAPSIVREADIVIAAIGKAELVRGSWLKPGAAVIDVGTNPVDDATKKAGFRLVGDVAFDEAVQVASFITPVPGGVGPMTIAMLLRNTLESWKRSPA